MAGHTTSPTPVDWDKDGIYDLLVGAEDGFFYIIKNKTIKNNSMNRLLKSPLSGIIPPLVTPLLDDDTLDVRGLECLIERLIDGGVNALLFLEQQVRHNA